MTHEWREVIVCTREHPWTPEKGTPVRHVEARHVAGSQEDGWPGGDTVRMRCPNCGKEWTKELPQ